MRLLSGTLGPAEHWGAREAGFPGHGALCFLPLTLDATRSWGLSAVSVWLSVEDGVRAQM